MAPQGRGQPHCGAGAIPHPSPRLPGCGAGAAEPGEGGQEGRGWAPGPSPAPGSGTSLRAGRVGGEGGARRPPPGGTASLSAPRQPGGKRAPSQRAACRGWARGHALLPRPLLAPLSSAPHPAWRTRGPEHWAGVRPWPCGHWPSLPWRVTKAPGLSTGPRLAAPAAQASGPDPEGPSSWTSRQAHGPCPRPRLQACAQVPRGGSRADRGDRRPLGLGPNLTPA